MPQANVWIKKELWDRWLLVEDKSGFVNEALYEKTLARPTLEKVMEQKQIDTCPHGYAKGSCKFEACNRRQL